MADISSYLAAIETAIKGKEVRGSIHDAIEAINNENITLHEQVVSEVEDIVTEVVEEAIDDTVLTFTYNPRVQSSGNIYINTPMTYTDIFASPLIELRWVVTSGGVITTYDGSYECIGKSLATTGTMGHLYFYNTYTESIIDVNIPTGTDPQYLFTYTEIPLPGGGGGSSYTAGDNIDITNNVISADIVEQLVTFSMSPTGSTPAYSVACNKSFSDISALVTAHKFKAVLEVVFNNGITRYLPLTQYKFGGGTTYKFYFEYEEDSTITSYVITKDYTQQTDVYTYEITTTTPGPTYTPGTGIDITNNVISVSYDNGDTEEY